MKIKTKKILKILISSLVGFILGFLIATIIIQPLCNRWYTIPKCKEKLNSNLIELRSNITLPMTQDEPFFYLQERDIHILKYLYCIS